MSRAALVGVLEASRALSAHVDRHPLDYTRWTVPQMAYLTSTNKRKLLRTGNRVGKSFVAIADVVFRALKNHPFRPDWNARKGPTHQWLITVSWSQSVPLQQILRSFLPAGAVAKAPNWDPAKGWGKDAPTIVFADGSTIGIRTMRQGPLALSGASLDHILADEPLSVEHYRELERRVVSRAGELSLGMTPVNAPGDLTWLRDMCAEGIVQDLHYPMTEDAFRYVDDGSLRTLLDGTVCDAEWIQEQAKGVPARWREIVIEGGWDEIITDGVFVDSFSPAKHVSNFTLDGTEKWALGIDHGTKAFSETAVLIAVDESKEYPHIYVVDCYEALPNSAPEQDARAILRMLKRHGLKWENLQVATGDIPHYGGRGKFQRKSNQELAYEIARELQLGKGQALSPPLRQAKTGKGTSPRGSVMRGVSWLHRAMLREGQFTVHPRATAMSDSLEKYRGGSEDPAGHLVDALRYAADTWINRGQTRRIVGPSVRSA